MAKGDRKFKQITTGVKLTLPQQRSIRKQINQGKKDPTVKVMGIKVTIDQLRTAQSLVSESQAAQAAKTKRGERLRYNKQGVATTSAGVQVTKQQARAIREQARKINAYSAREQYRATLAHVVETSKKGGNTTLYPTRARRAPLPYQRVDFSKFRSQSELESYIAYQKVLYDPKTRSSNREMYLGDTYKNNWIAAITKQVGSRAAAKIIELIKQLDGITFRRLMDSGKLDTVGDVYYGDPNEIKAKLDEYERILTEAVNNMDDNEEDIGL